MDQPLGKAKRIYRDQGAIRLIKRGTQFGYAKFIRPFIPRRTVAYNGITVRASHMGDSLIPWQETDLPDYECGLIRGIRTHVQEGETVVVVGGGWGVSTVAATNQVGENGQVITYEGGKESVEKVLDTVKLNDAEEYVSVKHAVVGDAVAIRGNFSEAKDIPPTKLTECDVLVLDCEGAEIEILEKMEMRPRAIIVETHGMYGATKADVDEQLAKAGFDTITSMVAEERLRDTCEENGIYVLFAKVRKPHR